MMNRRRNAVIIADLSYGDTGKGSLVDFLTRQTGSHTVVRFNGGAQAAHNVITPDGIHHTFAQFGSGTLVNETRTHLSRYMMVNPFSMFPEERHLRTLGIGNAFELLTIDRDALITTPYQTAMNRLREIARDKAHHGSCGLGIGETMSDYLAYGEMVPFARDLSDRVTLTTKLKFLRDRKLEEAQGLMSALCDNEQVKAELRVLSDPTMLETCVDAFGHLAEVSKVVGPDFLGQLLEKQGTVIFEGAQGVLLDEWYGFHPHTTWSTTTFKNALTLLAENDYQEQIIRLGVFRGYASRHGTGPFVTEDQELTSSIPDMHNGNNPWQRSFRVGYFDLVAARYALDVTNGADVLAITCLDRLVHLPSWKVCHSYSYDGSEASALSHFEFEGFQIHKIKVKENLEDLDYQGQLTEMLSGCKPNYVEHIKTGIPERDMLAYLSSLEEELGFPIGITSRGPTANDKTLEAFWLSHVTKELAA